MILRRSIFSRCRLFFSPGPQMWQKGHSVPLLQPFVCKNAQGLHLPGCPSDPALVSAAAGATVASASGVASCCTIGARCAGDGTATASVGSDTAKPLPSEAAGPVLATRVSAKGSATMPRVSASDKLRVTRKSAERTTFIGSSLLPGEGGGVVPADAIQDVGADSACDAGRERALTMVGEMRSQGVADAVDASSKAAPMSDAHVAVTRPTFMEGHVLMGRSR